MRLISSLPKYVYLQTRKSCSFTGHDLDNYFWLVRVILEKCYCQAYEQTKLQQVGQSYHDHNNLGKVLRMIENFLRGGGAAALGPFPSQ